MAGTLLRTGLLLSLALAAFPSSASAAVNHRFEVSVAGSLTHNFQANGDDPCEARGPGAMTVNFRTAKPAKLKIRYDFANQLGWLMKARIPLVGTRVNRDDTAPVPSSGDPCTPFDKSGCGSAPISSRGKLRFITGTRIGFSVEPLPFPSGPCDYGPLGGWDLRGTGTPLKLALRTVYSRKRTFVLRKTQTSRIKPDGSDDYSFETVRKVRITFHRSR